MRLHCMVGLAAAAAEAAGGMEDCDEVE